MRVILNTNQPERHKDDIADGIGARVRMQTSDKTGGIIFFGLNVCTKQTQNNTAERYKEKKRKEE